MAVVGSAKIMDKAVKPEKITGIPTSLIEENAITETISVEGNTQITNSSTSYVSMPDMNLDVDIDFNSKCLIFFSALFRAGWYYQRGYVSLWINDEMDYETNIYMRLTRLETPINFHTIKNLKPGSYNFNIKWKTNRRTIIQPGNFYPRKLTLLIFKR